MIVANDYVTIHMQFTGHFTGKLDATAGNGQAISFIATDLIKITDGRITDNWHIEDNLTLLTQMGIADASLQPDSEVHRHGLHHLRLLR